MPTEELKYFNETKQWILGKIKFPNIQCPIVKTFIPGPNPLNDQIFFNLFRRKYFTENSPYMIFFITFSNLAFQIPIVLSDLDKTKKEQIISMPIFRIPSQIYNEKYGTLQILNYDFSSSEKDYSTRTITMGYEQREKLNTSSLVLKDILYK